ncbi:MAG: class I SAM-dependent methyltransferase [Deltaproteobacteria bacterium]|nr:class I SAM-dependent methyltransferase [Deltaproteobacteria bacterium]
MAVEVSGYTFVRCLECNLYYVNPQPSTEELEHRYAEYYLDHQWQNGEADFNRKILKIVSSLKSNGSVLDIGCGNGQLLSFFKQKGHRTVGWEISRGKGVEHAEKVYGLEIFVGTQDEFRKQYGSQQNFDICILSNVLEHLKNPFVVLEEIHRQLKDDGLLVIIVPNLFLHLLVGRLRQWLGKSDPFLIEKKPPPLVAFDAPLHLTAFSPGTLKKMLAKAGYQTTLMRHAPAVFSGKLGFVVKDLLKRLLVPLSNTINYLTTGKVLIGYSILAIAKKLEKKSSKEMQTYIDSQ